MRSVGRLPWQHRDFSTCRDNAERRSEGSALRLRRTYSPDCTLQNKDYALRVCHVDGTHEATIASEVSENELCGSDLR